MGVPVLYFFAFGLGKTYSVFLLKNKARGREGGALFSPSTPFRQKADTRIICMISQGRTPTSFLPLAWSSPLPLPPSVTVSCSVRREWKEEEEKGKNLLPPTHVPSYVVLYYGCRKGEEERAMMMNKQMLFPCSSRRRKGWRRERIHP